ncbi:shikimate dehydrogenase [Acuticoccus mangrovi]|uniref:Shikimate dehydrogenase (NADP(+)) n=1 Tax=Acuticoccus mangrovi TaxID=2796142 RepID=A0A934MHI4_9HYPH|nr:shikimate dehydrogenase [Acuticoccus mangrovi]MBJ3776980.1 shikimate dehydrogenase [Acuticoccus mangrovi]
MAGALDDEEAAGRAPAAGSGCRQRSVLVGLLGRGIQRSRTPHMHEAEGRRHGLAYVYKLLDTDRMGETPPDIGSLVAFARHFGFQGLNVTYPFKQAIMAHLDRLSADAQAVGAVNTVVFADGRAIGHNTDRSGFAASFRRDIAGRPHRNVLQLGAGGAGAAVASALLGSGVETLRLHDVDAGRAIDLAGRLAATSGAGRVSVAESVAAAAAEADGLVNATPVGMAASPGIAIAPELIRADMWVADIVYLPLETELLRCARAKGCLTLAGRGMAIHQAAFAFELFTGIVADIDAMGRDFDALNDGA